MSDIKKTETVNLRPQKLIRSKLKQNWIDNQNALDGVPFSGVPECMEIYSVASNRQDSRTQWIGIRRNGCTEVRSYNDIDFYTYLGCFSIAPEDAQDILEGLAESCHSPKPEVPVDPMNSWCLMVTDSKGQNYRYHGKTGEDIMVGSMTLSDCLRKYLAMDDLIVQDGYRREDYLERITVKYERTDIMSFSFIPRMAGRPDHRFKYSGQLTIDGKANRIYWEINNCGTKSVKIYEPDYDDSAEFFMTYLHENHRFYHSSGHFCAQDPENFGTYQITLEYFSGRSRVLKGSLCKEGLPEDFQQFSEELNQYIHFVEHDDTSFLTEMGIDF